MSAALSRRALFERAAALSAASAAGLAPAAAAAREAGGAPAHEAPLEPRPYPKPEGVPKVYFTPEITEESLLKIFELVRAPLGGRTAIKLHTGEPGAPYLPPRHLIRRLQQKIPQSAIVECNVLYPSPRQKTETHRKLLAENGWTFCPVDIMDEEGDVDLPISGMDDFLESYGAPGQKTPFATGNHLRSIAVGSHLLRYDSMLVYTHFKGHASGGYGGSLKNIAIGCASPRGKRAQHGDGWIKGRLFQEHMAEAGKGIVERFAGRMAFINLLMNLSVDCDCAGTSAAKPEMPDLGILASTDLWAVDQASIDMIYARPEAERRALVERIESREGLSQLAFMRTLGMASERYELIRI